MCLPRPVDPQIDRRTGGGTDKRQHLPCKHNVIRYLPRCQKTTAGALRGTGRVNCQARAEMTFLDPDWYMVYGRRFSKQAVFQTHFHNLGGLVKKVLTRPCTAALKLLLKISSIVLKLLRWALSGATCQSHNAIISCIVSYCILLYSTILCEIPLYYMIFYSTIDCITLYYTICIVLCYTLLYRFMLYYILFYYAICYCIVFYHITLYYILHMLCTHKPTLPLGTRKA